MKNLKLTTVLVAGAIFGLCSCEKQVMEQTKEISSHRSMNVKMTDGPGNYAALDVTVDKISVYHETEGWLILQSEAQAVSVLELTNGVETSLANSFEMPEGHYSLLKLEFDSQADLEVYSSISANGSIDANAGDQSLNGSATFDAELNWENGTEVIIEIDETLSETEDLEILLDFQVAQSISEESNGTFTLDPVITVIEDVNTGVQGNVEGTSQAAVILSDGAQEFSGYIDAAGNFLIRDLPEGVYEMTVHPIEGSLSADQDASYSASGVVVSEGNISNVGQISFP